MNLLKKTAALLLAVILLLTSSLSAAAAEEEKIGVTVNIFDSGQYGYLLSNTSLNCPKGSTVEDLLSVLLNYALIEGFTAKEDTLTSLTAGGTTVFEDNLGNLVIEVNDIAVPLTEVLNDGDEVSISYFSLNDREEPSSEPLPAEEKGTSKALLPSHSDPNWNSEYASAFSEVLSWLKLQSSLPESIIALGSGGVSVEHKAITDLVRSISGGWENCLALCRYILAAGHCNMHAGNINNTDLLTALLNYPDTTREEAAWTLLALDCNDYPSNENDLNGREAALNYLLAAIGEDGGIAPSLQEESDPYLTALFITAAMPYQSDDSVAEAIDGAVEYLAGKQRRHGGFEDEEGLSFPALCMSVIALNACGLSTDDARFIKSGITLPEALLKFQNEDGGFTFTVGEASSVEASFLGSMALLSMKSGSSPFPLRTKVTGMGSITVPSPDDEVLTPSQPVMEEEPSLTLHPVQGLIIGAFLLMVAVILLLIFKKAKK